MSFIYSTYRWEPVDLAAICALQNGVANVPMSINGSFADPVTNRANLIERGSIRTLQLSSVNNLAAVQFVIVGTQNGAAISEIIAGPNNASVTTVNVFDEVISITPNAPAAGIRVGIGTTGYFPLLGINTKLGTNILNYGIQLILAAGTVTYNIKSTLVQNVAGNKTKFSDLDEIMLQYLDDQNASSISGGNEMASYYLVQVTASIAATTLQLIYTQV